MLRFFGFLCALPLSLLGLVLALAGGARPIWSGSFEVHLVGDRFVLAWFFRTFNVAAYTWGSVIVFASPLYSVTPWLLRHERRHVAQTFALGLLMPVAYGLASLVAALRGGHAYRDNWFEVDARRAEGRR